MPFYITGGVECVRRVLLQSALRLTEVLKEREAQIELKRLRETSVCGDNKETQAKLRADYEESLCIAQQEIQQARNAKIKCVEFQKAQYETVLCFSPIVHQVIDACFLQDLAV